MSPENTHKLMGFYMEGLILCVNTMYMLFCFFKLFLVGCIGLRSRYTRVVATFVESPQIQTRSGASITVVEKYRSNHKVKFLIS